MLYVMKYENQIFINKKWVGIGVFEQTTLTYNPKERIEEYTMHTFEELQKFAKDFYGLQNRETLFKKPRVQVRLGLSYHFDISINSFKKDNTVQFRTVYEKFSPTMTWLVENLSADDFSEYAKDRGWNSIVISTLFKK